MNIDYDNELNGRISSRNIPSSPLQPLYDIRSVSTKYTLFHTVDKKEPQNTDYNYNNVFNPGFRAPPNYYFQNIDRESLLRNQFAALQKSDQSVYVPELNSNLYENNMAYKPNTPSYSPTEATTQPLCEKDKDTSLFYNHIRTNYKK
uniref:Uncharacterized protein n=1 Tax=viral metagenome TaxID=1070528 RepID=A0A6C0EUP3_9ZZZZ